MNLSKLMAVCALALGGLTVGCGNKCKSVCEDGKDCAGADKSTDCGKECDDNEKTADKMDCSSQYDDFMSCLADVDDICKFDPTKDCQTETNAFGTCIGKYCAAHTTDADCSLDGST